MNDLFTYMGFVDELLVHGQTYMLELQGRGLSGPVRVTAPVLLEYPTWDKFFSNWRRVDSVPWLYPEEHPKNSREETE